MGDDFSIIQDALSRIERDKQNAWTKYIDLIEYVNALEIKKRPTPQGSQGGKGGSQNFKSVFNQGGTFVIYCH